MIHLKNAKRLIYPVPGANETKYARYLDQKITYNN